MAQKVDREPVATTEGTKFTNNINNAFKNVGEPLKTEQSVTDPDPITGDS